jgi:hypothetical protein
VNGTASTFMTSDSAPAVQVGTNSQKGIVQVDGTTITASGGVISAVSSVVSGRTVLATTTNYYITTTGNDSNPGTIGSPWLTLQHANDFIAANLDLAGHTVVINIGAGTFAGVALTSPVGGGQVVYLGATWHPTTTIGVSGVGDACVEVDVPLGDTAVTIANVTLTPGGTGAYGVAVFSRCSLRLGQDETGSFGAGIFFGEISSGSGIGIYAEGLCSISDGGGETDINTGTVTAYLSFMYLTAGAVYKKFGNWIFVDTALASNGLLFVDTNAAFVNLDGDTFYTNGPVVPGGIPFHLRSGGVVQGEQSYFGDVTYGIVATGGTFQWDLADPRQIPTDQTSKSIQTPTTGFSIAFPESTYALILNPAGTLATGAIALPNLNYSGKSVVIKSTQQITALTITAPVSGGAAVASGTYNSGTGAVSLTLGLPVFQFYGIPGQSITISGITGTGSVASLNGTFTATSGTSGPSKTVNYTIASGLTLTINSGTGNAASQPAVFGAPSTLALGGRIEAEYDLTTNAWYL